MKKLVVSYSLSGNNRKLATKISENIESDNHEVNEGKRRNWFTIIMDMILKRTPDVRIEQDAVNKYDLIILIGPIWMGQIATPLRKWMRYINESGKEYAFISISGGADGDNPSIVEELHKRIGREPVYLKEFLIADILPENKEKTRQETMNYKPSIKEIDSMAIAASNDILGSIGSIN